MEENENMESELVSRTRLYSSEDEIRQDQEKVVEVVLDKYTAFDYLKTDADLSNLVRTRSLEGLRKGIATFMEANNITDICDIFESSYFSDFYYHDVTYKSIIEELNSDSVLRNKWCDAERPSITEDMFVKAGFCNKDDYIFYLFNYECEHIAEIINCTYVNTVNKKKLIKMGVISPTSNYIDVPDEPNGFDD